MRTWVNVQTDASCQVDWSLFPFFLSPSLQQPVWGIFFFSPLFFTFSSSHLLLKASASATCLTEQHSLHSIALSPTTAAVSLCRLVSFSFDVSSTQYFDVHCHFSFSQASFAPFIWFLLSPPPPAAAVSVAASWYFLSTPRSASVCEAFGSLCLTSRGKKQGQVNIKSTCSLDSMKDHSQVSWLTAWRWRIGWCMYWLRCEQLYFSTRYKLTFLSLSLCKQIR